MTPQFKQFRKFLSSQLSAKCCLLRTAYTNSVENVSYNPKRWLGSVQEIFFGRRQYLLRTQIYYSIEFKTIPVKTVTEIIKIANIYIKNIRTVFRRDIAYILRTHSPNLPEIRFKVVIKHPKTTYNRSWAYIAHFQKVCRLKKYEKMSSARGGLPLFNNILLY